MIDVDQLTFSYPRTDVPTLRGLSFSIRQGEVYGLLGPSSPAWRSWRSLAKVEGLALTKLTNILAVVPLLAIIPSPWRYVAGVLPTYWIGELMFLNLSALPPWSMVAALAVTHAFSLAVLLRLFSDSNG